MEMEKKLNKVLQEDRSRRWLVGDEEVRTVWERVSRRIYTDSSASGSGASGSGGYVNG